MEIKEIMRISGTVAKTCHDCFKMVGHLVEFLVLREAIIALNAKGKQRRLLNYSFRYLMQLTHMKDGN